MWPRPAWLRPAPWRRDSASFVDHAEISPTCELISYSNNHAFRKQSSFNKITPRWTTMVLRHSFGMIVFWFVTMLLIVNERTVGRGFDMDCTCLEWIVESIFWMQSRQKESKESERFCKRWEQGKSISSHHWQERCCAFEHSSAFRGLIQPTNWTH
jgi:hypothetical protein